MLANIGPGRNLIRPLPRFRIFLNHLGPRHVAGHQVGRELDALERQVQRLGQRADQQRLGQPRHAFQQRVAAGEHRHQHLLDHFALTDDDLRQLIAHAAIRRAARSTAAISSLGDYHSSLVRHSARWSVRHSSFAPSPL